MKLRLTVHVIERMWQCRLTVRQIEEAITAPDWTAPERTDPALTRYYRRFERHTWRIVARPEGNGYVVITALPDRNARKP